MPGMAKKLEKSEPAKKNGRPTRFKDEYKGRVVAMAEMGLTDVEIGKAFGVSQQTVNSWKHKFPLFLESLKKGKAVADQKVVQSLYHRALGYSHPDTHIINFKGEIIITPIIKHYPPDTTACIFWLKNRDRENWRDKHETEITGKDGEPIAMQIISYAGASKP